MEHTGFNRGSAEIVIDINTSLTLYKVEEIVNVKDEHYKHEGHGHNLTRVWLVPNVASMDKALL